MKENTFYETHGQGNKVFPISKESHLLPVFFLLIGIVSIELTKHSLFQASRALGNEAVPMFIPVIVTTLYTAVLFFTKELKRRTLLTVILLYVLLVIPFKEILAVPIEYHPKDDAYVYSFTAKNMVNNRTLWGGDGLLTGTNQYHFMKQPGYRYYVGLWMEFFGAETRLFQFLNMFIYSTCITLLLQKIAQLVQEEKLLWGISAFVLLSTPFGAKMVMLGIGEWLALVLLILSTLFFIQEKYFYSTFCLSLAPFMRQNLFITSALLFIIILVHSKEKLLLFLCYSIIILLPLLHNVYYAKEFRLLVDYGRIDSIMLFNSPDNSPLATVLKNVLYHLSLYSGIDCRSDFRTNMVALTFIPFGTVLFFYMLKKLAGIHKYVLLAIVSSAIIPTLFFGWAYYPRFEFLNLFVAILSYLMIVHADSTKKTMSSGIKIRN